MADKEDVSNWAQLFHLWPVLLIPHPSQSQRRWPKACLCPGHSLSKCLVSLPEFIYHLFCSWILQTLYFMPSQGIAQFSTRKLITVNCHSFQTCLFPMSPIFVFLGLSKCSYLDSVSVSMFLPRFQPCAIHPHALEARLHLDPVEQAISRALLQVCTPDKSLLLVELVLFWRGLWLLPYWDHWL